MPNTDRMTIYVNDTDKKALQHLMAILLAQGVDVRDNRGEPSVSKMLRHLVQQELAKAASPSK